MTKILIHSEPGCDIFAYNKRDKPLLLAELNRVRNGEELQTTKQGPSETKFSPQGYEYSVAIIYTLDGQAIGECVYCNID